MKSSRNLPEILKFLIIFFAFATVISACQVLQLQNDEIPVISPAITNTINIPSTEIVLPTLIPTVTITPTVTEIPPTATATEFICRETSGTIQEARFYSDVLGEDIISNVYLPPCYDVEKENGYPLLVMLHGQNGKQEQWIDLGMTDLADEWISEERIDPLVIVMPYEHYFLVDSDQSSYDLALVDDLLPQLLSEYNLSQEWFYRAIGGLSRGGNWAVRIGFTRPEAFSKVGGHSYTTFSGDLSRVRTWIDSTSAYRSELWIDIGEDDPYFYYCNMFVSYLQSNQFPLKFTLNSGSHTIEYWETHLPEYLAWYTKDW
jgi:enterochelin esterase-like enzyme